MGHLSHLLLVFAGCFIFGCSSANVRLLFPASRDISLDTSSESSCEMPKGASKTKIEAGTTINVTWQFDHYQQLGDSLLRDVKLGHGFTISSISEFPLQGEFNLEVLDELDTLVGSLTASPGMLEKNNSKGWTPGSSASIQDLEIMLPTDMQCKNCTVSRCPVHYLEREESPILVRVTLHYC